MFHQKNDGRPRIKTGVPNLSLTTKGAARGVLKGLKQPP